MRAAVRDRYGGPEVLEVAELDTPLPDAGQVQVRVVTSTVTKTDCHYLTGRPVLQRVVSGLGRPRAKVLGCEYAGVVSALGGGSTRFHLGQRVFGYIEGPFGGHGEYLCAGEDGPMAPIPEGVSFEQAAASTEGSHYALSHLRKADVAAGQRVLVYGATGAIGSAAVQLCNALGCATTAVGPTAYLAAMESLKPDKVVSYEKEDFTRDALRYDIVFDAVGKTSFLKVRGLLTRKGRFMSSGPGPLWQNSLFALGGAASRGRRVVFGFPRIDRTTVEWFAELMAQGRFRPLVDRAYPLDDIAEAYRYVFTGQKLGNVLVNVATP